MVQVRKLADLQELKRYKIENSQVFQSVWYFEIFAKHFVQVDTIIILGIFEGEKFLGYGAFEDAGERVVFLGMKPVLSKEEVTDYGDIYLNDWSDEIVRQSWEAIYKWFNENNKSLLQLDYVREDSPTYKTFKDLGTKNMAVEISKQEVSPYIDLPNTWDEYLSSLERKERKELKRKMNRLNTVKNFRVCSEETMREDFDEFIRLHRLSDPKKERFMSEEMKSFFWDIFAIKKGLWKADLCFLKIDEINAASIMTFEKGNEILAYNSGYDPKYDFYSVGLLLHAFKIRQAIENKKKKYDFLRGGERYKFDLGAKKIQLYKIIISPR